MAKRSAIAALSLLLAACVSTTATSGRDAVQTARSDASTIGRSLDLSYRVIANRGDGGCRVPGSEAATEVACSEAEITLSSDVPLDLSGAAIFFSQVDPAGDVGGPDGIGIEHINGDLHRITFEGNIPTLVPGRPLKIPFTVLGTALTRAKFMPNYYVADRAGDVALIESTRETPASAMGRKSLPFLAPFPDDLRRAERDWTPTETPEVSFSINQATRFLPDAVDSGIVPAPAHLALDRNGARVDLSRGLAPAISGAGPGSFDAAFDRLRDLGIARSADGLPLRIAIDDRLAIPPEGYELATGTDAISIRASDEAGAFYGLQSLAALVQIGRSDIPALTIEDAPRFGFRGMHIDIARNFHGPATLRALIDQMAAYKLNKLHLHLADDEGWRLEIAGLPELTGIGSRRCHDPAERRCILPQLGSGPDTTTSGSGFLSEGDYIALLRYAAARHVEIIPALDMPGHARAAVKSMEARYARLKAEGAPEEEAARFLLSDLADTTEYSSYQHYSDNTINVCRPSAYRFVGHVLDRLIDLHERAGVPFKRYHIGADETAGAWKDSPLCQDFIASGEGPDTAEELGGYFVARVARMVAERGIVPAAWSDGLSHAEAAGLPAEVQSNIWGTLAGGGNTTANRHANLGWDVVISLPDATYFDFPYAAHPEEGGYYWAMRRVPTRKLFSMMPENLPAHAAYWQDRDSQPITIDDRPASGETPHRPLDEGREFIGLQGHIWTETVRDRQTLGYQIFPRMLALAERAWKRADWEVPYDHAGRLIEQGDEPVGPDRLAAIQRDWNRFASVIAGKELAKLELGGWAYRLPPAGARLVDGVLRANTAIPGLPIECDAGAGWGRLESCTDAVATGTVKLRTTSPSGDLHGRVVELGGPDSSAR